MGRFLAIAVALIVYASLYPFHFEARDLPSGALAQVFGSWPARFDRFAARDAVVNLGLYVPFGMAAFLLLSARLRAAASAALILVSASVLAFTLETCQLYVPGRTSSSLDIVLNVAGAGVGAVLARFGAGAFAKKAFVPSGPLLLLACWAGHHLFPFIPDLSRTRLALKLDRLLANPRLSAVETAAGIVAWLIAARLLQALGGGSRALAALMLLLPAKMLIAGRTVTWSQLVSAACAFFFWTAIVARNRRAAAILGGLSVAALALRGLAPFEFAGPGEFSWIPLAATFESERGSGAIVLLEKAFLYGGAAWLLRRIGYSDARVAIGLALFLGAIEAAQIYLPGRVAEITDPLLAVTLVVVLRRLKPNEAGLSTRG